MKKLMIYYFTLGCLLFLHACTIKVPIVPNPDLSGMKKYRNLKVGIFIEPMQRQRETRETFVITGVLNTWIVQVGSALESASVNSFNQIADEVILLDKKDQEVSGIRIVFEPYIREFRINQRVETQFYLKGAIFNKDGKKIYENEVEGVTKGTGAMMTACIGGVCTGKMAVEESVRTAFEDAFEKLFYDINEKVDFTKI